MLKRTVLPVLALTVFAVLMALDGRPASAQEIYPGRWWRIPALAERLELGDNHRRRLDDIYDKDRANLAELKEKIQREQTVLEELLDEEPLREPVVMSQLKKLESVRTSLSEERVRYVIEVRKVLGPDRYRQLKQFLRQEREERKERPPRPYPWRKPWGAPPGQP